MYTWCYGIHQLFNISTNVEGIPEAILIRGIKPLEGFDTMKIRSGKTNLDFKAGSGPGNVSKLLGIQIAHSGLDLCAKNASIWVEDNRIAIEPTLINITPRIGIESAGEAALYPYRFVLPKDF